MITRKPLVRKEAIFILAAAPALTGYFFSPYDLLIILIFTYNLALNKIRFTQSSLILFSSFSLVITASALASFGNINVYSTPQWLFFLAVLFCTWSVLSNSNWSIHHCFKFWAAGLIPNLAVALIQQTFPEVEIFNFSEAKSKPIPGAELIRASGLLYNPNSLAAYSLLCLCYYIFRRKYLASLISALSALLTFSKTFFLVPVIIFLRIILGSRSIIVRFALLTTTTIAIAISFDFIYEAFSYRIANADSLQSRLSITSQILENFHEPKANLIGLGPNLDVALDQQRVHNKLLSIYFQFGAIGILAILLLASLFVLNFRKNPIFHQETLFSISFMVIWILTAMVSTFTFFTFEYLAIILIALSTRRQERILMEAPFLENF